MESFTFDEHSMVEIRKLFIARDAVQYRQQVEPESPPDLAAITRLLASKVGENSKFTNVDFVGKLLTHLQHLGVHNLAQLHDWWRKQSDDAYAKEIKKLGSKRKTLAKERLNARDDDRIEADLDFFREYLRRALPHINSAQLADQLQLEEWFDYDKARFDIELPDLINSVVRESPNIVVGELATKDTQLIQAYKTLERIGYGDIKYREYQLQLYKYDLRRLAPLVSYQSLASDSCYDWLGERFKDEKLELETISKEGQEWLWLKQLYQHVEMISTIIGELDAIEMARFMQVYKDDYINYVARRREMIYLMERIGNFYHRMDIAEDENFELAVGLMAIYHYIRWDAATCVNGKVPSFQRVLNLLVDKKLLSVTDRTLQDWKTFFLEEFAYNEIYFDYDVFFRKPNQSSGWNNSYNRKICKYIAQTLC